MRAGTFAMRLADEATGGHEELLLSSDLFKAEAILIKAVNTDLRWP